MADEITAEPDANDDFDEDEGAVEVSDDGHHRLHVFSDLTLMNGANRLDELTAALERVVDEPWRRALERDESQSGLMEWRVFERRADEHLPGALLFLAPRRRDGAVYVSNIVPTRGRTLGKDNYNSILAEFTDKFVRGVAPSIALEVLLTQPWIDFADEIGPEAFHQLRAAANFKPGTHPMDRERWMEFILLARRLGLDVDLERLRRWLEADGFASERAYELMGEFDFGTRLLKLEHEG